MKLKLERYLKEMSASSDQLELDVARVFTGKLPNKLPDWMVKEGFIPGAKIISSKVVGGTKIKPDVIVTFDQGPTLRISIKMSNATFYGNWYTKDKVARNLGENAIQPIIDAGLDFMKKYKAPQKHPLVGVSVSFGKGKGQNSVPFTKLMPLTMIKFIVAGNNPNLEVNANSLYAGNDEPNNIKSALKNIKPITNKTIKELSSDFNVLFRTVYTSTNKSNMGTKSWVKLVANSPLPEKMEFDTQEELLKYTHWEPTGLYEDVSHNQIANDLEKHNIFVKRRKN